MKGMIFCAGKGTRLGEIGQRTPKCLLEVDGEPLLKRIVLNLKGIGIDTVIINLHHLGDQIRDYISSQDNFGIQVIFSEEEELLETGGGLSKAWDLFEGDEILAHNGDIVLDYDLAELVKSHRSSDAVVTLATNKVENDRALIFNQGDELVGWKNFHTGASRVIRESLEDKPLNYCGVQVISPEFKQYLPTPPIKESIIEGYLRVIAAGKKIKAYDIGHLRWDDFGTPASLFRNQ